MQQNGVVPMTAGLYQAGCAFIPNLNKLWYDVGSVKTIGLVGENIDFCNGCREYQYRVWCI
ncbi:hypothetical protein KH172YL63_00740 [Bacillus sp. KH172YL63]|nr:hypothetical protein KH172YL63_00740 [Bacillus sp. KH172YL63]